MFSNGSLEGHRHVQLLTCSGKTCMLHHACIDMLFSQPCVDPSPSPCPAPRVETKNFTLGNKSKFRFHNNYSFNIFYKNVCNAFLFLFRLCSVAFFLKKRKFSCSPNCNRCMQDVVPIFCTSYSLLEGNNIMWSHAPHFTRLFPVTCLPGPHPSPPPTQLTRVA